MNNRFRRCQFTFARCIPTGAVYQFDSFTPKWALTLIIFIYVMTDTKSGLRGKQEKCGVQHETFTKHKRIIGHPPLIF